MSERDVNSPCYFKLGEYIIAENAGLTQKDKLSNPPSTTTESQFYLNGRRFNLATSCSVSIAQQPQHGGLQFVNCPCQVVDNQLIKYFRISYKDTVIYVQDKITFQEGDGNFQKKLPLQNNKNQGQSSEIVRNREKSKKMVLFKSNALRPPDQTQKIDKKNIVKNVVSAFFKYLREGKLGPETTPNLIETVSKLIQTTKFNNQLITDLVAERSTRQYFKKFLILEGVEWIQNSKLKTKQIYKQALQIYQKLCQEQEKKEKESKRNSVSPQENEVNSNRSLNFRELENYQLQEAIRNFK